MSKVCKTIMMAVADVGFFGGRNRIRTHVVGLEGQSDIQLHYTPLPQCAGLFVKSVVIVVPQIVY